MAELDSKVFIYVGKDKTASFKAAHVGDSVTNTDSYYTKVAFLEDTNEIATRGKLFGLNNAADVSALTTYVGTMPTRSAVLYTQEEADAENAAHLVNDASGNAPGADGYTTTYEADYTPVSEGSVKEEARDYASIVEYIQEVATGAAADTVANTKTSADITVAGGPLADDIEGVTWPWGTKDGNKYIPAGTSFEEIFTKLFLAEKNGTVTLGSITWNPTIGRPTATISKTGEQEVGTTATVTIAANTTVSNNTRAITVTASPGYFLDDSTTYVAGNYTADKKTGTTSGTATISTSTWNGDTVANGDTVTIGENTNTLSVSQNGVTASVDALDSHTVYAATNTKKKVTSVSVSITDTKPADKTLTNSNSATVTGVRYMFGGSKTSQDATITSAIVRACSTAMKAQTTTVSTAVTGDTFTIAVVEGAKQVIVAVPAKYKVTAVNDKAAFGNNIFTEETFPQQTVSVEGANGYTATNYNVYVYSPASALGANTYSVKVETA